MKANQFLLIIFLIVLTSCKSNENKIIRYTANVPFSLDFYRNIEFLFINDSAFLIQTSFMNSKQESWELSSLTISSGKIFEIDNLFYAKDDLSGEIILFSKDDNYLHLYGSRYENLSFKRGKSIIDDNDFSSKDEENYFFKEYLRERSEQFNLYMDKFKDLYTTVNTKLKRSNDSVIEFSNYLGLSIFLYNDSSYIYTCENMLFSSGLFKFKNDKIIFIESPTITLRNNNYEISDKLQSFIEKNENVYTAWLINDSTLFMGTLPFAQSYSKMNKVHPGIRYKFFDSFRPCIP